MFNHLTYQIGSQCVLAGNVHGDLRQLSYGSVVAKSYGLYNINRFCFCSNIFEASRPLVATTNIGVVTRVVDAKGHESKYYRIIKYIIEYNFAGNKNLKIVFFVCDWFHSNQGTRENKFGMVEVYYMLYPCKMLSAWWVVYRVNPHERLHNPDDSGYHENQVPAGEVDEVYQDDELSCSFNIDPDLALNSLLGDANDLTVPEQRK
jgi:hypothetical protein